MSRTGSPLRDEMVFLVGARRSGTLWLQRALATHPDVFAVPSETYLFTNGIAPLTELFQHGTPESIAVGSTYIDRDELLDGLRDFCDRVFGGLRDRLAPGATRVLERTPWHAHVLPLIADVYPDARVIHIIRDGRDVARSLLSIHWGPSEISDAAREWRSTVEQARDAAGALAHYRECRYEDLLVDPLGQVTALYDWLGLPVSTETLRRLELEMATPVNLASAADRVGTGKWRQGLAPEQVEAFMRIAGPLLEELGYADADLPPSTPDDAGGNATDGNRPRTSWRGRLRGLHQHATARAGSDRPEPAKALPQQNQRTLDLLLAAWVHGRTVDFTLFQPTAELVWVGPDGRWRERGPTGFERLLAEWQQSGPVHLVRADAYPQGPTVTAVAEVRSSDGETGRRVLVAELLEDRISRLVCYSEDEAGAGSA